MTKSLDGFHRNCKNKLGHAYHCKDCVQETGGRWRAANREREKARQQRWYAKNRDQALEQKRRYRVENAEEIAVKAREKRLATDPEERSRLQKRASIKFRYGLTVEEYDALLAGGCAICGDHHKRMNLDHCHRNGKVRAALCPRCNITVGVLEDTERLQAAAAYIEQWQRSHGD